MVAAENARGAPRMVMHLFVEYSNYFTIKLNAYAYLNQLKLNAYAYSTPGTLGNLARLSAICSSVGITSDIVLLLNCS